jgi:hypothetical protein
MGRSYGQQCVVHIYQISFLNRYTESVWMNLSFSVSFRSCRGDSGMFRELGINNHPSSCSHVLWADQGRYKARFAFTQFAILLQSTEVHVPHIARFPAKGCRNVDRIAYPAKCIPLSDNPSDSVRMYAATLPFRLACSINSNSPPK